MMIKTAKIILMIQVIVCVLIPVGLFNAALESARISHEAQKLATQLAKSDSGDTQMMAQAAEIAAYLRAWRNVLPIGIVVLPIIGAIIGVLGWDALNQKEKKPKTVEPVH